MPPGSSAAWAGPGGGGGGAGGRRGAGGPPAEGAHADGGVATGDAGRLADDGRLWLLGRAANAVEGRYPFQVERAVEDLAWVGRAVLVRIGRAPAARGALVVEPRRWDPHAVGAWTTSLHGLARAREWPIDEIRLVRELPAIPGPASKPDTRRLTGSVGRAGHLCPFGH